MIKAQFKWTQDPFKSLDAIDKAMRRRIARSALQKTSRVMAKDLKPSIPKGETGLTKKSIGQKVKIKKNGLVVFGMAGARTKMGTKTHSPTAIYALLNYGTKFITGRHFAEVVWSSNSHKYLEICRNAIAEGLNREMAKADKGITKAFT